MTSSQSSYTRYIQCLTIPRRPLRGRHSRLADVPGYELAQDGRPIRTGRVGNLAKRIPQVLIDGKGALGSPSRSGGHDVTVSAACALPQHIGGRVGCCHGPKRNTLHMHCTGGLHVDCTGSNVISTESEHSETPPLSPGSGTGFRLATRPDQGRPPIMTMSILVVISKNECDSRHFTHHLPTLADPLELEDLQREFADVPFELTYVTPEIADDACQGCPEGLLLGPAIAEVVLVYRWWGHWVRRQPLGMCCAAREMRELVTNRAVVVLRVEVLLEGHEAA